MASAESEVWLSESTRDTLIVVGYFVFIGFMCALVFSICFFIGVACWWSENHSFPDEETVEG